jgi:hypothetical protein
MTAGEQSATRTTARMRISRLSRKRDGLRARP